MANLNIAFKFAGGIFVFLGVILGIMVYYSLKAISKQTTDYGEGLATLLWLVFFFASLFSFAISLFFILY